MVHALNREYSMVKRRIAWILSMERFAVKPLNLRLIKGHDVLLDIAHNLLGFKC